MGENMGNDQSDPYELAIQNAKNPIVQASQSDPYEQAIQAAQPKQNFGDLLHKAASGIGQTVMGIPGVTPFMNFNNQLAGGVREGVRNLSNPIDSAKQGYQNPQQSESFQHQLGGYADNILDNPTIKNMSPYPQAAVKTAVQFPFQLAGASADVLNNPLINAATGAVGKAAEGIGGFFKEAPIMNAGRMGMYNDINSTVKSAMPQAVHEMGGELNDLEAMGRGPIDVGSVVAQASQDPKVAEMLKEFPEIANAGQHTLPESQQFINTLKEPLPDKAWSGGAKPDQKLMRNLADDIQEAQYQVHPEKEMIDAKYGVTAEAKKAIPNTQRAISGARDPLARDVQDESLKTLIGDDAFNKVQAYRTIQNVKKAAGTLGKVGAAGKIFGLFH